jgi:hypothetical protein
MLVNFDHTINIGLQLSPSTQSDGYHPHRNVLIPSQSASMELDSKYQTNLSSAPLITSSFLTRKKDS